MISKEKILEELYSCFPEEKEEIEILEYHGKSKDAIFRCKKCQNTFCMTPANLMKRHSNIFCLNCHNPLDVRRQQKELQEKAIALFDNSPNLHLIELFQKPLQNRRRLAVRYYCEVCGEESEIFLANLTNDFYSCKYCQKGNHKTFEQFEKWLDIQYNGKFTVLNQKEYEDNNSRIHIKCNDCGFIFYPTVTSLKRPRKVLCPKCKKGRSRGELFIGDWLSKKEIDFLPEKNFGWLPNSHMRYDFVIPKYKLIIEYDGIQHTQWNPHFGSYEKFLQLQENDKIKNKLAIERVYKILRIPFSYEDKLRILLTNLFSSTTISEESRGKLLEIDSFL